MKVVQLRATLEEFAAIYTTEGHSERADALRALYRALEAADGKRVDDIVTILARAGTVTDDIDELSLKQ